MTVNEEIHSPTSLLVLHLFEIFSIMFNLWDYSSPLNKVHWQIRFCWKIFVVQNVLLLWSYRFIDISSEFNWREMMDSRLYDMKNFTTDITLKQHWPQKLATTVKGKNLMKGASLEEFSSRVLTEMESSLFCNFLRFYWIL